jgi:mono/diheme cytochrome c family protein
MHRQGVVTFGIAFAALAALTFGVAARGGDEAGRKVFLDNKCTRCHEVSSQGIASTRDEAESEGKEPVDLSDVGSKHDAAWIEGFLQRRETLDGHKHKKKFRGTDEELQALVAWLTTLRAPGGGA